MIVTIHHKTPTTSKTMTMVMSSPIIGHYLARLDAKRQAVVYKKEARLVSGPKVVPPSYWMQKNRPRRISDGANLPWFSLGESLLIPVGGAVGSLVA